MSLTTRRLAQNAVIAALYCALTLACAPISYGFIQFRVSEVFCILPFFSSWSVAGLYIGCMLANFFSSANIVFDVILGSLATLLAGLCTAWFGRGYRETGVIRKADAFLACLMPVVFNGPIVGVIWAFSTMQSDPLAETFLLSALYAGVYVAAGELAVMLVLGLPALYLIKRTKLIKLLQV